MTRESFELAKKRKVRLGTSAQTTEGHGLGLTIALDLAQRNDMTLELSEMRKSGTGLVLTLPD